jgi:hypothetical protein
VSFVLNGYMVEISELPCLEVRSRREGTTNGGSYDVLLGLASIVKHALSDTKQRMNAYVNIHVIIFYLSIL